uniref:hypothetical protein n=1 Tax=Nocardia suismassiliense TaxID=2077092 RepID=UPI003F4976E3
MTDDGAVLPLSAKVDRLFAVFHTRTQPEQSNDDVARSISTILDREVEASELTALRNGAGDGRGAEVNLLAALAAHFQVPLDYLTDSGSVAAAIDRELRLLAAARDAGVRHLALRGDEVDIEELTGELSHLADDHPNPPDQAN